jgi:hypothetical protein
MQYLNIIKIMSWVIIHEFLYACFNNSHPSTAEPLEILGGNTHSSDRYQVNESFYNTINFIHQYQLPEINYGGVSGNLRRRNLYERLLRLMSLPHPKAHRQELPPSDSALRSPISDKDENAAWCLPVQ